MAITARIGSDQGGDNPYSWLIEYDDVTRHVTATGTCGGRIASVTVIVTITTGGGTRKVQFMQTGQTADGDTDFAVGMGAGPTVIGPTIAPAAVARVVGKIGTPVGGLPFTEDSALI